MLNTFPDLLILSFTAPLILRLFLGIYLIKDFWGELINYKKKDFNYTRLLKILGALGGILLILGLLTQIVSLFLILIIVLNIINIKNNKLKENQLSLYILILGILLSLVLSGAGFLAMDMPL
ncbi:MAG: hypothetical protein KAS02_01275 [Candidatus Pacebacteria bacterium]|nr:hypothetical protein [Candidatus Paceibacterota bacterium]